MEFFTFMILSFLGLVTGTPIPGLTSGVALGGALFADPAIICGEDGTYFAFSTTQHGLNVPVANSSDFETWTLLEDHDALPNAGKWTTENPGLWAPDVVKLDDGSYVMYYSAFSSEAQVHCIGAARSNHVIGPYKPDLKPMACNKDEGGSIDASGFRDPATNKLYVMYKVDGNNGQPGGSCGNWDPDNPDASHSTPIRILEVSPDDGVTPIGPQVQILDRDARDGPLVEAPAMMAVESDLAENGWMYILFFSSQCFNGDSYDASYATSINGIFNGATLPDPPCTIDDESQEIPKSDYEKSGQPLLMTGWNSDSTGEGAHVLSPGGLDVLDDGEHVVFHSNEKQRNPNTRQMRYGKIRVDGRKVTFQ